MYIYIDPTGINLSRRSKALFFNIIFITRLMSEWPPQALAEDLSGVGWLFVSFFRSTFECQSFEFFMRLSIWLSDSRYFFYRNGTCFVGLCHKFHGWQIWHHHLGARWDRFRDQHNTPCAVFARHVFSTTPWYTRNNIWKNTQPIIFFRCLRSVYFRKLENMF